MFRQHTTQNWLAVGVAGLATVLFTIVFFLDWGSIHVAISFGAFGGVSDTLEYTLFKFSDTSWYDGQMDDGAGVGAIRAAIPLWIAGGVFVVAAILFGSMPPSSIDGRRVASTMLLAGGSVLLTLGAALHLIGAIEFAGEFSGDGWQFASGFAFVILTVLAAIGATAAAVVAPGASADGTDADDSDAAA